MSAEIIPFPKQPEPEGDEELAGMLFEALGGEALWTLDEARADVKEMIRMLGAPAAELRRWLEGPLEPPDPTA